MLLVELHRFWNVNDHAKKSAFYEAILPPAVKEQHSFRSSLVELGPVSFRRQSVVVSVSLTQP